MKKIVFLMIILFNCSVGMFAQEADVQVKNKSKDEQEVIKLERLWLNAYEQRDAAAMERIIADNMTITYPNGAIQRKPQIIAFLKTNKNSSNPAPKFTTFEVEIRSFGKTIILNGRLITERNRNGQIIRERSRYTDVYHKIKGHWQVVASHLSNDVE